MDAFVAHAPARLPLATNVKFTENGQRLEPGDGTWRTVTAKGGYALTISDVDRGQAVLMGTIREADVPTIFVVRLGVAGQQIAEIETLVIRNQMAAENLDRVARPRPAWYEAVPPTARPDARRPGQDRQHVFLGDRAERRERCLSDREELRASGERLGDRRRSGARAW